jgi:uncharacterized membrane-anchored protein YjiN (DUF445 family)
MATLREIFEETLNEELGSKNGKMRLADRDAFSELVGNLNPKTKSSLLSTIANGTNDQIFAALKAASTGMPYNKRIDEIKEAGDFDKFINSIKGMKTTESKVVVSYDRNKSSTFRKNLKDTRNQFADKVATDAEKRPAFSKKTDLANKIKGDCK